MSAPITIIALEACTADGQAVAAGDRLEVTPMTALALVHQHKARYVTAADALAAEPARRRYRRRDLIAES